MKKRKHRVVVEITTDKHITAREARQAMSLLLERVDADDTPIWANAREVYAVKLNAREYERVARVDFPRALRAACGTAKGRADVVAAVRRELRVTHVWGTPAEIADALHAKLRRLRK